MLNLIVSFCAGLVIGSGVGFLVFRNNAKKFRAREDELRKILTSKVMDVHTRVRLLRKLLNI